MPTSRRETRDSKDEKIKKKDEGVDVFLLFSFFFFSKIVSQLTSLAIKLTVEFLGIKNKSRSASSIERNDTNQEYKSQQSPVSTVTVNFHDSCRDRSQVFEADSSFHHDSATLSILSFVFHYSRYCARMDFRGSVIFYRVFVKI